MAARISYATLGAADLEAAVVFYDAVLPAIGWRRFNRHPGFAGYGPVGREDGESLWICRPFDGGEPTSGNGTMLAFAAKDRSGVDAFHAAALAAGAGCEGPPGPRPHYGPDWYAAYLRDPTGNKLAIVCTTPAASPGEADVAAIEEAFA